MKRKRLLRLASLIIAVNMTFGMIPGFVMADETDASEDEDTSIEITFDEEEASDEIAGDEDAIDAEVDDETDADVAEAEDVAEASDEEEAIVEEDAVEDIAEPEEDAAVEEETASVELTFDEDDAGAASGRRQRGDGARCAAACHQYIAGIAHRGGEFFPYRRDCHSSSPLLFSGPAGLLL